VRDYEETENRARELSRIAAKARQRALETSREYRRQGSKESERGASGLIKTASVAIVTFFARVRAKPT